MFSLLLESLHLPDSGLKRLEVFENFSACLCEVKGNKLLKLRPLCREQQLICI